MGQESVPGSESFATLVVAVCVTSRTGTPGSYPSQCRLLAALLGADTYGEIAGWRGVLSIELTARLTEICRGVQDDDFILAAALESKPA